MGGKQVYSICGMCTVRCPIQVEVQNNRISFNQGNPHAAGLALWDQAGGGMALQEHFVTLTKIKSV